VLVGGALGWAAKRHLTAAAVVPYSIDDRRMTFAILPFVAPGDDPRALQVAKSSAEAVNAELEADALWAHAAPRRSVEEAVAHLSGVKDLAKALDVHFLIRGTVAKAASGYALSLVVLDGSSERSLGTQPLAIPPDSLVPRWHDDVGDAVWRLLLAALEVEVKRAADRPLEALDVRDLSFRAFATWRAHRGKEAKAGYLSATELLNRALALAPDDPLATYLTAEINLCDCVMAWSENVEEQKAIGAAALEKYLRIDPNDAEMLADKALLFQLRGRYDESLVITDSMLQRDPNNANALGIRAAGLLRLGRPREALPIAEALVARYPDRWPSVAALAADVHFALGDFAVAAQLARNAAARMSEAELRSPVDGPIRLTLAAAEAELGHRDRARAALADFNASVPGVTTVAAVKKWMHQTADLAEFEPLLDGLRLAGLRD
jgi:tetratricopeptide (TPR) repeat protein